MSKTMSVLVLGMMLILVGFASAVVDDGSTLITGKVYNADFTSVIEGANVEVVCNGYSQFVVSQSNGKYSAIYSKFVCDAGDSLNVVAEKNGMYGSASGIIHEDAILNNWDLGVVNVAIVPEFGFFIGMLTLLSAVGIFFVVRK
ncbi:hypothetical protein KAI32_00595 [Candidatus Pacearchaeota archaeon]|nr:hypothetical protein [Candidatus Pacearchaeota archaeon]